MDIDLTGLLEGLVLGPRGAQPTSSTPTEVAGLIRNAGNIIVAAGAGISVASGIPDFRSPTIGLYANLQKYDLPRPEAIFEIEFFRDNPQPFYTLSKELYDPSYKPTKTHYFIRLLHDKGVLRRCYTQNIDSLESKAGVPKEAVIAAHGNFDRAGCIECRKEMGMGFVGEGILAGRVVRCGDDRGDRGDNEKEKEGCGGLVKPSIVFFGEQLPQRFWSSLAGDFEAADLLIVMGSSLVVQPFASLVERTKDGVPRVLINREAVGRWRGSGVGGEGGDPMLLGDCDAMVEAVCDALGWAEALRDLVMGDDGVTD